MKNYTLITGASSGIGLEMAKILAERKHNLILVSRSKNKLLQLKTEILSRIEIEILVIEKDLSISRNAFELFDEIKSKNLIVNQLINNAGVGVYGEFTATSIEEELKMIELNVSALVILTKLFAQEMVVRKSGVILNVASLLSFLPFPYYSVYSATKAFVLAFSETVNAELEGTGVMVKALCPGPVDTGFTTSEMATTKAYKTNKPVHPEFVAKEGIKLLFNTKSKKIVGFSNWFISNLPRITPDFIMMKIKKNLASQIK
jgi:short-subunit dehydrogenase